MQTRVRYPREVDQIVASDDKMAELQAGTLPNWICRTHTGNFIAAAASNP